MKKFAGPIMAVALMSNAPAFATYVDTVNVGQFMNTTLETATITHNLPNLPYVSGSVTIFMHDDSTTDGAETAAIDFNIFNPINASSNISFNLGALGILAVNIFDSYSYTVTRLSGDFWLDKSVLSLETRATPVPEPGTVTLLAAGLLGIVGLRKLRRRA